MEFSIFWPIALLLGLCIGSFLNVCIYRIPRKLSVAAGSSMCPCCNRPLKPWDLVPVVSYLALGAKCRYCKCRISIVYPMIELVTGALFVAALYAFGISLQALVACTVGCVLIAASMMDIQTLEIPDGVSLWIAAAGLVSFLIAKPLWWERLLGILAAAGPLFLVWLFSGGRAMGMGDIKLMAAVGLVLGWKLSLVALMLGIFTGALTGAALILTRAKGRKDEIPFVPMLSAGILLALFFGEAIIGWYLSLLG